MNVRLSVVKSVCLSSCLGALLLTSAGCTMLQPTPAARPVVDAEVLESLNERIRVVEESLPLLACGPEVKALLQDVRALCEQPSADSLPICDEKKLKIAIVKAERELDQRVGKKLLAVLRHEILYLTENGELASKRAERVAVMAKERRMPSTKFLIVAGGDDGLVRARHARALLVKHGIPEKERVVESDGTIKEVERFETAWKLPLNVQATDLRSFDKPSALEPKDLSRAVFVFRTDYL